MTTTTDTPVALVLRKIEIGQATQTMRADPVPIDPGRRSPRTQRDCQITFEAGVEGLRATFVIHIGWDGREQEACPVEQLEDVGRTLVKEFAARLVS